MKTGWFRSLALACLTFALILARRGASAPPTAAATQAPPTATKAPPSSNPAPPTLTPKGPAVGGTLTYALPGAPSTLDADKASTGFESTMLGLIGANLVVIDPTEYARTFQRILDPATKSTVARQMVRRFSLRGTRTLPVVSQHAALHTRHE